MKLTANFRIDLKYCNVLMLISNLFVILFLPVTCNAQIEITLKNSFIEKYKNRATIDATFKVDKAHKKPNPPTKDGDMHIAGRSTEVGLPIVAEIMNAKFENDSV